MNGLGKKQLPLTPVFQTVLVYFKPDTILLFTWKVNFNRYWLPSFRVNHKPFGFPSSGMGRTMSSLSGDTIDKLVIFTSGSKISGIKD